MFIKHTLSIHLMRPPPPPPPQHTQHSRCLQLLILPRSRVVARKQLTCFAPSIRRSIMTNLCCTSFSSARTLRGSAATGRTDPTLPRRWQFLWGLNRQSTHGCSQRATWSGATLLSSTPSPESHTRRTRMTSARRLPSRIESEQKATTMWQHSRCSRTIPERPTSSCSTAFKRSQTTLLNPPANRRPWPR